jgi:hypothetical protein
MVAQLLAVPVEQTLEDMQQPLLYSCGRTQFSDSLSVRTKSGLLYCSSLHRFISILEMTGAFVCHCWFGMPKSINPVIPTCRKGRPSYAGVVISFTRFTSSLKS